MKIIKSLYILLVISSLLMGVSGCMSRERYRDEVIKEMMGYLEEKYDEKFVATEFLRSGNGFNRPVLSIFKLN